MLNSRKPEITVSKRFFSRRADVFNDLASTGFWPLTLVTNQSTTQPPHYHDLDSHAYIMEGKVVIKDVTKQTSYDLEPGDKVIIPAYTVHLEMESSSRVIYIISIPEARRLKEFLPAIPMKGEP